MSKLTNEQIERMDATKNQIRCLVSNVYDLQKLRIAAGNRLVQSFYLQLGVKPSESPDEIGEQETKLLTVLKKEYESIQQAVAENNFTIKKAIKTILQNTEDTNDNRVVLQYVQDEVDYKLVDSYMLLAKAEETSIKVLDKYVKAHPLWDEFFSKVKGCGPLMSAVCIAYLDVRKARYVSSFYKYCGLDTVRELDDNGNMLFVTADDTKRKVRQKFVYTYKIDGTKYDGRVIYTGEYDEDGMPIVTTSTGEYLDYDFMMQDNEPVYEVVETGETYVGNVYFAEHGRRKGDTEMFEYTDKNGKKAMKRGITYNPVLKTKLMGVLTSSFLKCGSEYAKVYYDYRARLDGEPKHANKTAGHKNMMAQRYMIKQFLRDLWVCWRELEGLEVNLPYEVAKLGHAPHKYNKYQCDRAALYNAQYDKE